MHFAVGVLLLKVTVITVLWGRRAFKIASFNCSWLVQICIINYIPPVITASMQFNALNTAE